MTRKFTDEEKLLTFRTMKVASPIPLVEPGTLVRVLDRRCDPGEFIYLKGTDATSLGSVVTYNPKSWSTRLLVSDDYGPVAVALSACWSSYYGWYRVRGTAAVRAGKIWRKGDVFASLTPGQVDGDTLSGARLKNARFVSFQGTPRRGFAECEIWWPQMT